MVVRRVTLVAIGVLALMVGILPASPAVAADTAMIDGVVHAPDGISVPDGPVKVTVITGGVTVNRSTTVEPSTGAFSFTALPRNTFYYLTVEYQGTSNIVKRIGWDGSLSQGASFSLAEGERRSFDITLLSAASVSGTISGVDGTSIPSPRVTLTSRTSAHTFTAIIDASTGVFTARGIPAGEYVLTGGSSSPAWDDTRWIDSAGNDGLTLTAGAARDDLILLLPRSTSIAGTVMYDDGSTRTPRAGYVTARRVGTTSLVLASSDSTGRYAFYALEPGSYSVCFQSSTFVEGTCYGGGGDHDEATVFVAVGENEVVDSIDGVVTPAGRMSGRVLYTLADGGTAIPVRTAEVRLYRLDVTLGYWVLEREVTADSNWGKFAAESLRPGDYVVQARDTSGVLGSEYWPDSRYFSQSDVIALGGGEDFSLGDIVLSPRTLDVERLGGLGRFDVNIAVSGALFPQGAVPPDGVPVVYVASGLNFPDALAAGPAAAFHGGAVLLVEPGAIPDVVKAELRRLRPQRIVVAGGPGSVSPAVFDQLRSYADEITREDGIDRYEASRNVVRGAFIDTGADLAIIATGANFPDALTAGPAAASQGAPVILVDGSASSIDHATRDLILDLGIDEVYIAGGIASVSPGVEYSLRSLLGASNVTRFAGAGRFEVAVMMNQAFFDEAELAFLATGFNFPDALSGVPLAAAFGSPLYLAPPECVPVDVAVDILDVSAQGIVLLGGPASLTPAVERLQLC